MLHRQEKKDTLKMLDIFLLRGLGDEVSKVEI